MRQDTTYEYVTETAKSPAARWSCKNLAAFHAFNPNGAVALRRASDAKVRELVDLGRITSGHLYTVGSLAGLSDDRPELADYAIGYTRENGEDTKLRPSRSTVVYMAARMLEIVKEANELYASEMALYEASKASIETSDERNAMIDAIEGGRDFLASDQGSNIERVKAFFGCDRYLGLRILKTYRAPAIDPTLPAVDPKSEDGESVEVFVRCEECEIRLGGYNYDHAEWWVEGIAGKHVAVLEWWPIPENGTGTKVPEGTLV